MTDWTAQQTYERGLDEPVDVTDTSPLLARALQKTAELQERFSAMAGSQEREQNHRFKKKEAPRARPSL